MKLKKLSQPEKERIEEIKFYMLVNNIMEANGNSIKALSIIEGLADIYGCNITVIKTLAYSMSNRTSIYKPDKVELGILLYKAKVPVRKIRSLAGIHQQTLYRYIDEYKLQGQYEFSPRLDETQRVEVVKFLSRIGELGAIMKEVGEVRC